MDVPLEKLAIVLQVASTGGWRYIQRLIQSMRNVRPRLQVTCFLGESVVQTFASDQPVQLLESLGASVVMWQEFPPALVPKKFRLWRLRRHRQAVAKVHKWREQLNDFDAVFYAWPYGLECPNLKCPVFFIPHDFNYLHFSGSWTMSLADCEAQKRMHQQWLTTAHPIVSSRFIADEIVSNFPEQRRELDVIPLARLSNQQRLEPAEAKAIVQGLGVHGPYILSPNNVSPHKNVGQVLTAFYYLRQRHPHLQLVISGHNTAGITGSMRSPYYVDRDGAAQHSDTESWSEAPYVFSVGMRSDREIAALIQCAQLVVNASLYEAGNGAGLDAWSLGTPVAMSDIPAFVEHRQTLGVQAELFHPRNCFDICEAMARIIENPQHATALAEQSSAAMQRYTWEEIARRYLDVIDRRLCATPL